MKFILLIVVLAVLTFIATEGSPLPKEEKNSENEKNSKEDTTDNDVTEKETKSKSNKDNNKKSTPEPVVEEEENQYYIMVPAGKHGQKFKPNYNRIKPTKPKYVYKPYPTIPFPYPMFQDQEELMEPETEIEYSVPKIMNKMTELREMTDLPMYYIPPRKGRYGNTDDIKQIYQQPFIYQDKESWNPYLQNPGYYK